MVERVLVTEAAAQLLERLRGLHGDLLFHQSGGCCDGSSPMCYPAGEFRVGEQDVYLGRIGGCPFYMGAAQFEDLAPHAAHHRRGAGVRFRLFSRGATRRALSHTQPRLHR